MKEERLNLPLRLTEERIDLSEPISEICRRLDIEPTKIFEMHIYPDKAHLRIFYKSNIGGVIGMEEGDLEFDISTVDVK